MPVDRLRRLLGDRLRTVDHELDRLRRLRAALADALDGMDKGECPAAGSPDPIGTLPGCAEIA
ncbi:hypothetical protein HNP84_008210 [Thermocatellispora tengchongensis]|uniref:Uncharacterized protein n=1 Tax=Thermocatellispora tengchongensis TaxID=1073253 RepID=A0A840PHZ8_9ACTN|nr:hypothetical protein [Thermocatellispora tengchongensis]MBB5138456.1 hypothetical protein [Thermocatellispora tengchongensis]